MGQLSPCGTYGAYQRHRKRGEEPCAACVTAQQAYMRNWHTDHPGKRAEYEANRATPHKPPTSTMKRAARLRHRYGMSLEQWETMFERQDRRCACCGTAEVGHRTKQWQVDHDHVTGRIRGIVCMRCNRQIAQQGDSAAGVTVTAARLLAYLARAGDALSDDAKAALCVAIRAGEPCQLPGADRAHPDRPARERHAVEPSVGIRPRRAS